jgi:type II secretory pathway predicted ATPase ExeA/outer membrane protein OmpA-like peptidoglycan-associated protein
MYLPYYGLNQTPFSISPDPNFLWLSAKHQQAFSALKYGILEEKGFLALIGEVGTGKTLLIKNLIKEIGIPAIIVTIPDPDMETLDFFTFLAEEAQMKKTFKAKGEFLIHFKQFLLDAYGAEKKVLLIVDEAQRLNFELLEQIRLLSNIEMTNKKLLNIFFVGQNEFNDMLNDDRNKATRQRIAVRYKLEPLDGEETAKYIEHRLEVAGASREIFTPDAVREIYDLSDGFPRIINIICDNALMIGYGLELETIDSAVILEYKKELHIPEDRESPETDQMPAAAESVFTESDIETPETNDEALEPQVELSETNRPPVPPPHENAEPASMKENKPKPVMPNPKRNNEISGPPLFEKETSRKMPSYLRGLIIMAFFLVFGFIGYYLYESKAENSARWSVQEIAPKTDFKVSETEPEKIIPKNAEPVKKPLENQFAEVSPLKSIAENESESKEIPTESAKPDKTAEETVDQKLIAKAAPEATNAAESPNKKEDASNSSDVGSIHDVDNSSDGGPSAVKQDTTADEAPGEKLVAKVLPKNADIAEFPKIPKIEKKPIAADSPNENQAGGKQEISPEIAAQKAIDNHIENFYINGKKGSATQEAPLLEDLSIIGDRILIYFNYDSLELSEQSRETLRIITDIISKYPNSSILIEGYTDAKGNYWYNEKLSQARADAVKSYFSSRGISPLKVTAEGRGSENPRGDNRTVDGRRKNRRVEIKIEMDNAAKR